MDEQTPRLSLPFLDAGQAQKEITHNEALMLLDLAVHATVEAVGTNTPPDAPVAGQAWIVGDAPTSAWSGMGGHLAGWTTGGWRFVAPPEGMRVWSRADGVAARFAGGGWNVPARPSIGEPSGGTVVDAEARSTLAAVLALLVARGWVAT